MRKEDGSLHFYVNGVDQGLAATNVPDRIFGVIDLYGQASQASIVQSHDRATALSEAGPSSPSSSTIYTWVFSSGIFQIFELLMLHWYSQFNIYFHLLHLYPIYISGCCCLRVKKGFNWAWNLSHGKFSFNCLQT